MPLTIPLIGLPAGVAVDTTSDRTLHESIKSWEGYADLGLPKSVFFKSQKIDSPGFIERNPLVVKLKQRGKIIAYGYQRANRAKEHGEPLIQKKIAVRQSLADAWKARAIGDGITEVEIAEQALAQYLGIEL